MDGEELAQTLRPLPGLLHVTFNVVLYATSVAGGLAHPSVAGQRCGRGDLEQPAPDRRHGAMSTYCRRTSSRTGHPSRTFTYSLWPPGCMISTLANQVSAEFSHGYRLCT